MKNNIYGITGIRVKIISVINCVNLLNTLGMEKVNDFLAEYDGNIIDIQAMPVTDEVVKFIITYKEIN